jgi:hypothetical protein
LLQLLGGLGGCLLPSILPIAVGGHRQRLPLALRALCLGAGRVTLPCTMPVGERLGHERGLLHAGHTRGPSCCPVGLERELLLLRVLRGRMLLEVLRLRLDLLLEGGRRHLLGPLGERRVISVWREGLLLRADRERRAVRHARRRLL